MPSGSSRHPATAGPAAGPRGPARRADVGPVAIGSGARDGDHAGDQPDPAAHGRAPLPPAGGERERGRERERRRRRRRRRARRDRHPTGRRGGRRRSRRRRPPDRRRRCRAATAPSCRPTAGSRWPTWASRNGTFLDGVRLTSATVPVGAVLRVGTTLLQLMPDEVAVDIPPSSSVLLRRPVRREPGDAPGVRHPRAGQRVERLHPLHRRERHRQGAGRARRPRAQRARAARSWCSTAARRPRRSSRATCSATGRAPSPARWRIAPAPSPRRTAAPCSSTRSATCRSSCSPSSCACSRRARSRRSARRRSERFDVRVVAATHRDLWDEVGRGAFRGDLYYRLAVVEVHLPPLRQRPADIAELVRRFLAAQGADAGEVAPCGNLERLAALPLAGQRPRAAQRDRARGRPVGAGHSARPDADPPARRRPPRPAIARRPTAPSTRPRTSWSRASSASTSRT